MGKTHQIISRYWQPLLALNAGISIAAIGSSQFLPRVWTANSQIILPTSTIGLDANVGTLGQLKDQGVAFSTELSPVKVQASIVTSNDVMVPVWQSDPERKEYPTIEKYKKLFKVKSVDQATIVSLEATATSQALARQRLTKVLQSYEQRLNKLRQGTVDSRQSFSKVQLKEAEAALENARDDLAQFRKSSGLVDSDEQAKSLVQSIDQLTNSQIQLAAQAEGARSRTESLAQQLGMSPEKAVNSLRISQNKEYQMVRQRLSEIETMIAAERGRFKDESPQIQLLLRQRQELKTTLSNQLGQVVSNPANVDTSFGGNPYKDTTADLIAQLVQAESEYKANQRQADQTSAQISVLRSQLTKSTANRSQLLDLQRRYEIAEGIYKGIVGQLEQAKLTAFNAYPNVQVLDQPYASDKPSSPRQALIILGSLLASALGSAALLTFLDSRSPWLKLKDVQGLLAPILLRLPRVEQSDRPISENAVTEVEFQRLASTVSLMSLENRRLLITSAITGEGKTTVTLGLAMALVDLGFRVLIVDGDFRKAEISQQFGYAQARTPGLPMTIQVSPGLELLPTAPNPHGKVVELIARGRFERDLNALQDAGKYDFVIIDSAPLSATSETALIAKAAENVLMVVSIGISDRYLVHESLEQLSRHQAKVMGLALNGVQPRSIRYSDKPEEFAT